MIIVPGRFNVIAKTHIKRGVGVGTKGLWMETDPNIIRMNNHWFKHFSDSDLEPYLKRYAPFMVMWNEDPNLFTLHPADDDRLQFIPEE